MSPHRGTIFLFFRSVLALCGQHLEVFSKNAITLQVVESMCHDNQENRQKQVSGYSTSFCRAYSLHDYIL